MMSKCVLSTMYDSKIPMYVYDSYTESDEYFSLNWAKPYNKRGLLFPCWSFDNWEDTVKQFDTNYVEWTDRSNDPYFVGADTSHSRSNIRKLMKNLYPNYITLSPPVRHPIYQLMDHKLAFDLAGAKPWSVRSAYIALAGCVPIRTIQYYSKWNEKTWIHLK